VFAFELLPTRGLGIWKAWLGVEEIGWRSPIRGPVHPMFVPIAEPSGLGWLDGFDELLVRCGLESNGAPDFDSQGRLTFPLHGRIANRPAHLVRLSIDGDTGEITLTGEVEETRFHFLKLRLVTTIATRVGETGFRMTDRVVNLSQSPAEFQLLYHVNFGQPLLDAGARLVVPAQTVVPRNARAAEGIAGWDSYPAEQPGYAEQVYFLKLLADEKGMSQVLFKNAHATRGVSLRFHTVQLPCFTIWKNTTSAADGCVTGLEPGTNFPNPRGYEGEQGRVVKLPPGGSTSFVLELQAHGDTRSVASAEAVIAKIRGSVEPKIHNQPQPGWCAE
jgi:galactose mutarotase-like enzyme